ncbi:MAG: ABC transporter substrate-binding protein [bacterium]|nr:ABC transporter substrate-binding protein [bacterium]
MALKKKRLSVIKIQPIHIIILLVVIGILLALNLSLIIQREPLLQEGQKPKPIIIGWIGPLSGSVSFLGTQNVKSVSKAVDEYNVSRSATQPEISLVTSDDSYKAETAVALYEQMVATYQPKAIFVNTYSAMFPIAQRASKDNVIIIDPLDNDRHVSILSPNIFLIAKRTEDLGKAIAADILAHGYKTVKITYYAGDDFMPSVAFSLNKTLGSSGVAVVMHNYTVLGEEEIAAHVDFATKIRPDVNVFLGYSETGVLMKKYRDASLHSAFYAINTAMVQTSRGALEGTRILQLTGADGNLVQDWTAAQAYDAASILMGAIKNLGGQTISPENLKAQLLNVKNFKGLSGNISINPDGSSTGITWGTYIFKKGALVQP